MRLRAMAFACALSFACSGEEPGGGAKGDPTVPDSGAALPGDAGVRPDSGVTVPQVPDEPDASTGPEEPTTRPDAGRPQPPRPDAGEPNVPPTDAGEPAEPSMPPDLDRVEVGDVQLDMMTGESGDVTFTLPNGVTSFTVIVKGDEASTYILKKLEGPTGVLVSDDDSMVGRLERLFYGPFAAQFASPNRVLQDKGTAASFFPNNPGVTVAGGEYTARFNGFTLTQNRAIPAGGMVRVEVLYRTEEMVTGRLNLSLYFSGAANMTAATAPTNPVMVGALERLREIYGRANIEIGDIAYYDVDPMFRTITGIDGTGDMLERLFKNSAGRGPGLHFFFVDRFEAMLIPGANVAGIAGGLPGAPLHPGSVNSGVAVALAMTATDPGVLAHVMAHEGGHWLGLYHTSEIIGTTDQMPDTPAGRESDGFLMYPTVGGATEISPNQAVVLRNHGETRAP